MSEPQAPAAALTPEELAEIAERAEKATPGPWRVRESAWEGSLAVEGPRGFDERRSPFHTLLDEPADAHFIAHAREDIPALLATVSAQAKRIDAVLRIKERAERMMEKLKFDSSDRVCIVDYILTGATWKDGVRTEPPDAEPLAMSEDYTARYDASMPRKRVTDAMDGYTGSQDDHRAWDVAYDEGMP